MTIASLTRTSLIVAAVFGAGYAVGAQAREHKRYEFLPAVAGAPPRPYSGSVQAGDILYLSGNTGTDPATGKAPAEFLAAAKQSLANHETMLKAAGLTWADVTKVNVYVTDMAHYAEFNELYMKTLTAPYPARTFIAVAALPAGGQVEVEMVAVKRR
jgi:2-iminobutanoate/2-iminopropanoate deaminase